MTSSYLSLALILGAVLLAAPAPARAQSVSEPALKAAFLLNFVKFTEWPPEVLAMDAPLVVCSTDADVAPALENTVAKQTIQQHRIIVARVTLEDRLTGCAVLYVGHLDRQRTIGLAGDLRGKSVLTVGDDQAFAKAGGMIGMFVEGGRMRFAINIGAVANGRLRLSAKLLSLAQIVQD